MDIVIFKLLASPALIQAASLAGRRWGQVIGGWLVGLPLTSGPVVFFLALDRGEAFAARAAQGSLAGTAAQALFCVAYGFAARQCSWPLSFVAGAVGFALGAGLIGYAELPLPLLVAAALAALALALSLVPRYRAVVRVIAVRPRWDIPLRMALAAALVLGLTGAAPLLGAEVSGMLATFPVFAAILAVFAHKSEGKEAAAQVLRGLLIGLFGFVGFFCVLSFALERTGIAPSFAAATAVSLLTQGISLALLRQAQTRTRGG